MLFQKILTCKTPDKCFQIHNISVKVLHKAPSIHPVELCSIIFDFVFKLKQNQKKQIPKRKTFYVLQTNPYIILEWSDTDLIAQAVLFFVAGFETVSTTMTFLLYELALHPEVQDRLLQEIRENDAKNGGKFDYNSIQNLKYLDMVISGKASDTFSVNIYKFYLMSNCKVLGEEFNK